MTKFDDHFSEPTVNLPHPSKRCVGDPTVFTCENSSAIFTRHVDDGLEIGTERDLDTFFAELEAVFAMKVFPPIEQEEQQHLGVHVKRTKEGFNVRNRDDLLEDMLGPYDLGEGKSTTVPGTKAESRSQGEKLIEDDVRKLLIHCRHCFASKNEERHDVLARDLLREGCESRHWKP